MPELASYLKLTHERHEKEFTTLLLDRARKKFFLPNDENCIWAHEKVSTRIKSTLGQHLKLSETETSLYEPANAGMWFIDNAQFVSRADDGTYHWQNPTTFVQAYNYKKHDWQMSLAKDNANPSLLEALASFISKLSERTQTVFQVTFVVFWSVKLTRDGRFFDTKIEKILFQNRSFGPIDDQLRKRFKLTNA